MMGTPSVVCGVLAFLNVCLIGAEQSFHVALLSRNGSVPFVGRLTFTNKVPMPSTISTPTIVTQQNCQFNEAPVTDHRVHRSLDIQCTDIIPQGLGISQTGITVKVPDDDVTMHVLQDTISSNGGSGAGYLAISDEHLGTEYYVVSYCSTGGVCQFAITPVENGTELVIRFSNSVNAKFSCNSGSLPETSDSSVKFILNEYDVLHFESTSDPSGTHIAANKKIAVFAGARNAPMKDESNQPNLIEQIPPVNLWGLNFVVVPKVYNECGDLVKIVSRTDNTEVYINEFSPFIIANKGAAVEKRIDKNMSTEIKTSKPVLIVQIMGINLYNDFSDVSSYPAMVLVQPVHQWTSGFIFLPFCDLNTGSQSHAMFVSLQGVNVQGNTATAEENIDGTSFKWGYIEYTYLSSWYFYISSTGKYGIYMMCPGAAYLLHVNWTEINTDCKETKAYPGDGVDNNCNEQIDEDTCTEEDVADTFTSTLQNGAFTIGSVSIADITWRFPFTVKLCHGIASIQLATDDNPGHYSNIQITRNNLVVDCSDCERPLQTDVMLSNCEAENQFYLQIIRQESATNLTIGGVTADGQFSVQWTSLTTKYAQMLMTSAINVTTFKIDLSRKDCGKMYSGEADTNGKKFIAPVFSTPDSALFIIVITATSGGATVKVANSITLNIPSGGTEVLHHSNFTGTYNGIYIESSSEVFVYVFRGANDKYTTLRLIPLDVLGPSYYTYVDEEGPTGAISDHGCHIFSFDEGTKLNVNTENQWTTTTHSFFKTKYSDMGNKHFISANQPIATFCGNLADTMTQSPPKDALGTHFYIPEMTDLAVGSVRMSITTTEDSTVTIIQGNYDHIDTFNISGQTYTRDIANTYTYEINSTKPIQVHLEARGLQTPSTDGDNMYDSDDIYSSVVVIPPVNQYKSIHIITDFNGDFVVKWRVGIYATGSKVESTLLSPNITGRIEFNEPAFTLTLIKYVSSNGSYFLIPSDRYFKTTNKVCTMSNGGKISDGIDNDCDGMVDEETCSETAFDDDLDGSPNEDCGSGTIPNTKQLQLDLNSISGTCVDPTSNAENRQSESDNDSGSAITQLFKSTLPSTSASSGSNPPAIGDDLDTLKFDIVRHPMIQQPGSSTTETDGENGATTNTTEETCYTACLCPCSWVQPAVNYTEEQLMTKVLEIQEKLKVDKQQLSANIRTKISVFDDQVPSLVIGYAGLAFLVTMLGLVVLVDAPQIMRDIITAVANLRQSFVN